MRNLVYACAIGILSATLLYAQTPPNPFANLPRHIVVYFGGLGSIPTGANVQNYEFLYIQDKKDTTCYLLMRNTLNKTETLVKTDKTSCK